MEESSRNLLESLIISVVTLNYDEFRHTILKSPIDLRDAVDSERNNILHELAKSVTREQKLIDFIDLLISCVSFTLA